MPLVALNVECPECRVPFLAPHCSPSNAVQCPHCGGQHLLSRCREVSPEMLAQRKISYIRTSGEENAEILESSRSQQMSLLLVAGSLVVLLGLGVYGAIYYNSGRYQKAQKQEFAAAAEIEAADKVRYDEAFATAKRVMAASEWQTMLQSVRARERVLPQAQWVYQRKPHQPMHLISYQFPQDMHVGEDAFVRLYVSAEEISTGFWIRLQNSGYGWQLDWEALGRYAREHWAVFIDEKPTDIQEYRVYMQRSSVPDRHYYERGFTGEGDAIAVKIWAFDPELCVHAIVDVTSLPGQALAGTVRWDSGEGYIAGLRWPEYAAEEAGYQFIDVAEILQPGWHINGQAQIAANANN
ncbi:MAG: hypothetical protein ACI9R3_002685 [Verrucomicrobiales bacterium]|jgi:hypothetical protein